MRDFEELTNIELTDQFIQEHPLSFLYISRPNCSVCHGLKPQIQELMENYPKIKLGSVDASEVEEIAGRFSIFTVPVLLLFVDGKEYVREARIVHMELLDEKINKIYENVVGS
ncbi:thioredoxin family protein [Virgibacillus ainsalahensis]